MRCALFASVLTCNASRFAPVFAIAGNHDTGSRNEEKVKLSPPAAFVNKQQLRSQRAPDTDACNDPANRAPPCSLVVSPLEAAAAEQLSANHTEQGAGQGLLVKHRALASANPESNLRLYLHHLCQRGRDTNVALMVMFDR